MDGGKAPAASGGAKVDAPSSSTVQDPVRCVWQISEVVRGVMYAIRKGTQDEEENFVYVCVP